MSLLNPLGIQTTAGRPVPPRRRSIAGELAEYGGKTLMGLGAAAGTELIKAGMGKGSALQDALVSDRVKAQQAERLRLDKLTALSPAVVAQTQARAKIGAEAMSQGGQTERREMQEAGSTERLKLQLDAQEKMDNINIEAKRFSMEMQRYNAGLDSKFGKKRKGAKGIPRGIQKGFDDARSRQAEMLKKAEETRDPVLRQSYLQEGRRAYERMMQFQEMIDERFGIKSPDRTDFKSGEMPPPKTDKKTEAEIKRLEAQTSKINKEMELIDFNIGEAQRTGANEAEKLRLENQKLQLQEVEMAIDAHAVAVRDYDDGNATDARLNAAANRSNALLDAYSRAHGLSIGKGKGKNKAKTDDEKLDDVLGP